MVTVTQKRQRLHRHLRRRPGRLRPAAADRRSRHGGRRAAIGRHRHRRRRRDRGGQRRLAVAAGQPDRRRRAARGPGLGRRHRPPACRSSGSRSARRPILNGQTAGSRQRQRPRHRRRRRSQRPDGNTIYISTAGGGAWKTINGGQRPGCRCSTASPAHRSAGAIAVAPSDPRVIYLGTGEADNSGRQLLRHRRLQVHRLRPDLDPADRHRRQPQPAVRAGGLPDRRGSHQPQPDLRRLQRPGGQRPDRGLAAPGVWRYDGSNWFDLTGHGLVQPQPRQRRRGAPNKPGPDDDFRITFPQSNATWSDLAIPDTDTSACTPPLRGPGHPGGNATNGVFRCSNPTSNAPIWYVGDGVVNSQTSTEFPTGAGGSTDQQQHQDRRLGNDRRRSESRRHLRRHHHPVDAATCSTIQKSTDGGQTWAAIATRAAATT